MVSSIDRIDRLRRLAILVSTSSLGLSRRLDDLSNETGDDVLLRRGRSRLGRLLSYKDLDLVVGHLGLV